MNKEIAKCGNCRYVYYGENFRTEEIEEKCSVIGESLSEFDVNPKALGLVKMSEEPLLCEYHLPARGMEKRVTYNLKEAKITPIEI
jgi:hypothetical protein